MIQFKWSQAKWMSWKYLLHWKPKVLVKTISREKFPYTFLFPIPKGVFVCATIEIQDKAGTRESLLKGPDQYI